ncbi:UDP-N-acetylmuramoyl-tripeptide--D-alanyl-D-alanine ligase [Paenibacillus alkaliterrae]|uniref:UDP-N-acetylmuramoyl-tripeptide--D-alanyl-D- alanine ligase n=1 Tax=Paenibacillus alkaliterrae TaxID=320909 RepID=UPI001F1B277D|nr:UDP-N-acetylmuramoyl-tripeptide--D-alanyl-D-alanine ligase [Paenibacillus alkaliterrae]MCF2940398.1 UDP-N-acetylmuramoyl-tripeptide--D-alanyl-D-alanine ligase [Paenibacillus alkaliterrae]
MEQTTKKHRPVIAVTGSAGKTTSKEMIAAVLNRRWKIFKSPHNNNAPSATKRHARQLRPSHRAVVVEYGMQFYGNIKRHCLYLQPSIGVITNVGRAHVGHFGGRVKGVARAKSELIRYMKPTGTLLLNADDPHSELLHTKEFTGRIIRVGIWNKANYRAFHVKYANNGMSFKVKLDKMERSFYIPAFGEHNIYNALFAIAVSHGLGFTPQQMQAGLHSYARPKSRLRVHRLRRNVKLIDDSYSSNPDAAKAALDVLSNIGTSNKIAVLGSMLELGKFTTKGHQEVGKYAAGKDVSRLYTLGSAAKQIAVGARKSGFPAGRIKSFVNKHQLQKALLQKIESGATVLIKGSNSLRMSTIVTYLKQNDR